MDRSTTTPVLIWTVFACALMLVGINLRGSFQAVPASIEKIIAFNHEDIVSVGISSRRNGTAVSSPRNGRTILVARPKIILDHDGRNETNRRKLYLVHVGKTGGETVRQTLEITCRMRANPVNRRACYEAFRNTTRSPLSQHTIGTIHCGVALPPQAMSEATTFVWTLRNPIERVISWFRYTNPANCIPQPLDVAAPSVACNVNRSIVHRRNKWAAKFFNCFGTVNDFAISLNRPRHDGSLTNGVAYNVRYSNNHNVVEIPANIMPSGISASIHPNCSKIAWRTILGEAPTSNHLFYNHGHYWNETVMKYPDKEIWVIRTESLWNDIQQINQLLSSEAQIPSSNAAPQSRSGTWRNVTHGSETYKQQDSYLSDWAIRALCCALDQEFHIYIDLIQNATNLLPHQKETTISTLLNQCKAPSQHGEFRLHSFCR